VTPDQTIIYRRFDTNVSQKKADTYTWNVTFIVQVCQCGIGEVGYGHPWGGWGKFEENGHLWCNGSAFK
jgi:hypothetical protein